MHTGNEVDHCIEVALISSAKDDKVFKMFAILQKTFRFVTVRRKQKNNEGLRLYLYFIY